MTETTKKKITPAMHIGFNVVAYKPGPGAAIEILQSDSCDEGAYIPPSSIGIHSTASIKNLRDFCDQVITELETP